MKKVLCLAIATIMVVGSLAACGAKSEAVAKDAKAETTAAAEEKAEETAAEAAAETEAEAPAKTLKFGQIGYNYSDSWCEGSVKGFKYAADQVGVEVMQLDAENNAEKMISALDTLINEGVDGISIFTLTNDLTIQMIAMCNEAGIPVVVENAALPEDKEVGDYLGVSMLSYSLCQEKQFAYIGENFPGSNVVFVSGSLGANVAEEHMKGIEKYMEENPGKVASLTVLQSDWTAETSLNVVNDYITSGDKFDIIVPNTGGMCLGVLQAIKNNDMQGEVKVISSGGQDALKDALASGELTANTNTTSLCQGMNAMKILYDAVAKGERLPADDNIVYVPPVIVTADNIDDFLSLEDVDRAWELMGGIEK